LTKKRSNVEDEQSLCELATDQGYISSVIENIRTDKGSGKYPKEKALRKLSEERPQILLPHIEGIIGLVRNGNTFIRSGALISLSNLIAAAPEKEAQAAFSTYLEMMSSPSLIVAGNGAKNAAKIARANPSLEPLITANLLAIPRRVFLYKGEPSPECRNIMVGNALDCFSSCFDCISDKKAVLEFALSAKESERASVARKAENLLHIYGND
jgi:hypothetical protein